MNDLELKVFSVKILGECYLINDLISVNINSKHRYVGDVDNWITNGGKLTEVPIIQTIEEQTALANAECSKRINAHWNQIGQINASLGVYGEEGKAACAAWISSNRVALVALLERLDLLDIDVTSDEHWPAVEGAN